MIYLHVPFCRSFCTYCDFYSERCARDDGRFDTFVDAIAAEIRSRREEIAACLAAPDNVDTWYIGGGTPSVLPLSVFRRLCGLLGEAAPRGTGEFTVEVNPEDIVEKGPAYVQGLVEAGVNRISMGVQSLDDGILRWMNRRHDAARAAAAFRLLRSFPVDISVDLIFGLPQCSDDLWKETLDRVLNPSGGLRPPEHISAYQLTLEAGSALGVRAAKGQWQEATEEQCWRQYDLLCDALGRAGYRHYEVSNFALPGHEAVHNSAYWRRVPYIGLGPGAHSLLASPDGIPCRRCWNSCQVTDYAREGESLSEEDVRTERIMLGLRTDTGLPEASLRALTAPGAVDRLLASGALAYAGTAPDRRIRIPESHFFTSDAILLELV